MPDQPRQTTAKGHGFPGGEDNQRRISPGNPYAATPPRGNVKNLPGIPGAQAARLPTGPYNDPVDSHPGPIGPPAVRPWQADSSSEYFRTHREHYTSPQPQGPYVEQMSGETRGDLRAPDPKWNPEPVIRKMYPPAGSQFVERPFDKNVQDRFRPGPDGNGYHQSMAGFRRSYQLIPGERPVTRLTSTYRIVPPSLDERNAAVRGQPQLSLQPAVDRSQNGSWRLF